MNRHNLNSMSVDELWSLHELVVSVLARKISSEQAGLEQKLRELGQNTPDSLKGEPTRGARTRRFFRSTEILPGRQKLGPVAENNHAG